MFVTQSQSRALRLLSVQPAWLVDGYMRVRGVYHGDNSLEEYIKYDDLTFVQYKPREEYKYVTLADGRQYDICPTPNTLSKKTIGELINKGLVEIKIETTQCGNRIYAEITKFGQKTFSEL